MILVLITQDDDKEKSLLGTFKFNNGEFILNMFRIFGQKVRMNLIKYKIIFLNLFIYL